MSARNIATSAERRRCLLIEFSSTPALTYSSGLAYLQAACAGDPNTGPRWQCEQRVVQQDTAEAHLDALLGEEEPDLVAFSVYFWNREVSQKCARAARERWPKAMIIFGGNDVTNQADAVFRECPQVDIVVHGEGEVTFPHLLATLLEAGDLASVPGISFQSADGFVTTRPRDRIAELADVASPYLTGIATVEQIASTSMVIFETNRGCPYSCAFCFWGAATKSKVRQFPLDRVLAELDFIIRHCRPGVVLFIADANFGILGRDLAIAEEVVRLCRLYSKQINVMTNWAKNSNSKVVEIASVLYSAGLTGAVTLSAQSFDDDVLRIAHRSNIKLSRYRSLQSEFIERGIPTYTDLLWGLPGESLATFLRGVDTCVGDGGNPVIYPLLLLNNTEYSQDRYRHEHGVRTRLLPADLSNPELLGRVVVEHHEMTEDDWLEGIFFRLGLSLFWKCLVRSSLTILHEEGVPVSRSVGLLAAELRRTGFGDPVLSAVVSDYTAMISDPDLEHLDRARGILGGEPIREELHYQALLKRLTWGDGARPAMQRIRELLLGLCEGHSAARADLEVALALDEVARDTIRSTHGAADAGQPRAVSLTASLWARFAARGLIPRRPGLAGTRDVVVRAGNPGTHYDFTSYAVSTWHGSANPLHDAAYDGALAAAG